MQRWTRANRPAADKYVSFIDFQIVYKVRINSFCILDYLLSSVGISVLVNAIAWVLHRHDVNFEILAESAQ